ncbi:hypothetical protein [Brevibacillus porteri]|uniref:hypothetical protein n=1 Tax=Brevibacillus porteri TaxID=2126350 RepID=UPI002E1B37B0|nr:hypothetical protein [Brevibacillus porteri]MED2134374.1 hypothetical protein [Brevibacillus porteri]MED2897637.1 hypothetical protein [Brevibacillus porteri]
MAVMMVFTLASSTQAASNEANKVNQPNKVQANQNYLFNFWHNGWKPTAIGRMPLFR